jgi:hypothetical protein
MWLRRHDLLATPQRVARGRGVWERLHRRLLDRLGEADQIEWERASIDSASVAAPGGAKEPVRIRRIRERRARSATLFRTGEVSRSR